MRTSMDLQYSHTVCTLLDHRKTIFAPQLGQFAAGWAARIAGPGFERRIRLDGLPPQLKLEVQYALQRRNDERAAKAPPVVVMAAVRFLAASGASSLLDRTRQEWRDHPGRPQKQAVTQLTWFRAQIADLAKTFGLALPEHGHD